MQNKEYHPLAQSGWNKMKSILDKEMPARQNSRRFLPLFFLFLGLGLALVGYTFLSKNVADNGAKQEFFERAIKHEPNANVGHAPMAAVNKSSENISSTKIGTMQASRSTLNVGNASYTNSSFRKGVSATLSKTNSANHRKEYKNLMYIRETESADLLSQSSVLPTAHASIAPQANVQNFASSSQVVPSENRPYIKELPQLASLLKPLTLAPFMTQIPEHALALTSISKATKHDLALELGAFAAPAGSYRGAEFLLGYKRVLSPDFYIQPFIGAALEHYGLSYVPQINKVYTDSESLDLQSDPLITNGTVTIDNRLNQVQSFTFLTPQIGVNLGLNLSSRLAAFAGIVGRYYINTNLEKFTFAEAPLSTVADNQNALFKHRFDLRASVGFTYTWNHDFYVMASYVIPMNQSFYTEGALVSSIDKKQAIKVGVGYNF